MAGHSQFKNIMHRKGRQDAQKSKLFGKLAREITVAAKLGTPDPAMNPRLRAAVVAARQENMPKDNIERAIKKAIGGEGDNYDEIRYEGYGPGGVAVIVEALTDNRNRAASDIRSYFTKSGGNLGETGSVAFMFDRTGIERRLEHGLGARRLGVVFDHADMVEHEGYRAGLGQDRPARPGDEPAAARRHHRGARGKHAEGQYRARHQEGARR